MIRSRGPSRLPTGASKSGGARLYSTRVRRRKAEGRRRKCRYPRPPPNARIALIRSEEREKLKAGQPHTVFAESGEGTHGALSYETTEPGDYELIVFNQGRAPASVHVSVMLEFPMPRRLSPERRTTVIVLSFAVFFGIVTWSARRLLRAVRR